MELGGFQDRYTPKVAVFAPLIVLTLLFLVLLGATSHGSGQLVLPPLPVMLGGALAYALAAVFLIRFGLANITRLEELGLTDSLSQLPNRRALHLDAQRREGEKQETALALIDLDGFKAVNDHYGHFIGDRLIKEYAALLTSVCGSEGRVYRLGGDEFAILASGPIAGNILEGICRKLLILMIKPMFVDDRAIVIGASIGLARSGGSNRLSSSELLRRTDVAMYVSKNAGKMRCTWFSEEFDRNRDIWRELDLELRRALDKDEFRLHYQPLVDADGGRIVAVEALLRWEHPEGKQIGPNVFIPIAEESGLINAIGLWVLRRACADALEWDGIMLSVNVSAAQLRNPEFPIDLGHLLEESGFPPARLEIEITETHLVLDSVVANRSLDVLREFGVRIVLDDFGTGYASIGFLRKFRFEKLKLDRSMIVEAAEDGSSRAMMLASVAVARSLDMDVTAEGVETEAQAALARAAGCDQIQGWLYHRAMPADQVSTLLAAQADESSTQPLLGKDAA